MSSTKNTIRILTFIFIINLLLIALFQSGVSNKKFQNVDVELFFNENNAYEYVEDQLNLGFRIPGTEARKNCAQYFVSKFRGISSEFKPFLHNFTIQSTECQNVLFKLNEDKNNIMILGAHYDSRVVADRDPEANKRNEPVPGANDGASGSAVLIELARVFFNQKDRLDCQIWFLFFDAEDQGGGAFSNWDWCEGSKEFVREINDFCEFGENFDCMILLDMVGGSNLQFINEQYSTELLLEELFEIGRNLGYTYEFPSNPTSSAIIDDHKAFLDFGIPSADLIINFMNNPNWPYHHTTKDDIEAISNYSLGVTGKTMEQFVYNNYRVSLNDDYKGNFPWNGSMPSIGIEQSFIILIISSIFIGIIIIVVRTSINIKKRVIVKNQLNATMTVIFIFFA